MLIFHINSGKRRTQCRYEADSKQSIKSNLLDFKGVLSFHKLQHITPLHLRNSWVTFQVGNVPPKKVTLQKNRNRCVKSEIDSVYVWQNLSVIKNKWGRKCWRLWGRCVQIGQENGVIWTAESRLNSKRQNTKAEGSKLSALMNSRANPDQI